MAEVYNHCIKFGVYLIVFCYIVGGTLVAIAPYFQSSKHNNSQSSSWNYAQIAAGIFSFFVGLLLLFGALMKHATCVLVCLVLMFSNAVIRTSLIIYVLIVFGSSLGGYIVLYILALKFLWATVHCVYLFYKSLVQERKMSNFSPVVTQLDKEDMA